jgi:hypothetical protein
LTGISGPRGYRRGRRLRGRLERVIGAALIDRAFCSELLESPVEAGKSFNLSPEELEVLRSASAGSLEELAAHIHLWAMETSGPALTAGRLASAGSGISRLPAQIPGHTIPVLSPHYRGGTGNLAPAG